MRTAVPALALGDLRSARAHWIARDTILWSIPHVPGLVYQLHHDPAGKLWLDSRGVMGGTAVALSPVGTGSVTAIPAKFPHLRGLAALNLEVGDPELVRSILKSQVAVS